jgi:hypothetical protein
MGPCSRRPSSVWTARRERISSRLSHLQLPPLPADANADVLVVDATVAFNYPVTGMLDRFGRLPCRR